MNITKGDVLELRRRLKKTECTFGNLCGCYVNSGKQVVVKFSEPFSELEEDEFYKYLEIAKRPCPARWAATCSSWSSTAMRRRRSGRSTCCCSNPAS